MKKTLSVVISLLMLFGIVLGVSACSDMFAKLPTTNYEKVKFAFNGVEKSLNKKGSSAKKLTLNEQEDNSEKTLTAASFAPPVLLSKDVNSNDISTIYGAMSVERETSDPSFQYDEPPMIQFQYMKALYEEVGEDFSFGTKYTYNLTGEIYYDFSERKATESAEFLTRYSMDVSVKINIDDKDLITAEVGFDLTYTSGSENRRQKRYSELVLDYDMNETSPTYTLTMLDLDDLLSFENADEKYISAEYDHVEVDKNKIKEWRKFGVCSPQDLSEYQSGDFVYKYSVLRAFKDNKVYRIENSYNKSANLKAAVMTGLGFIEEMPLREAFYGEAGTQNGKIQTVVNKFNNILGKDIVNSLVYTGATEKWTGDGGQEQNNLYLRVIAKNGDIVEPTIYRDAELIELFDPNGNVIFDLKSGEKDYFSIYLKNGEQEDVAVYNDFNDLTVKIRSTSYNKTEWVNVLGNEHNSFSSFVGQSGFKGTYDKEQTSENPMTLEFDISLKSDPNVKLQSPLFVSLVDETARRALMNRWDLTENYLNAYAVVKDAIPVFEAGEDVIYASQINEDGTQGYLEPVSADLSSRMRDYVDKLKKQGFVENSYYSTYTKRVSDDQVLVLTVYDGLIRFEFKESQKQEETITDAIKALINNDAVTVPEFSGDYEYGVDEYRIRIQSNDSSLIANYVASLSDYGFIIGNGDGFVAAYKYANGIIYRIRNMGSILAVERIAATLTAVGDFNGWSQDDTTNDFTVLSVSNDNLYFEKEIELSANQGFKIVKNHSWADGGYGFGQFTGSTSFDPELYEWGENGNIIVRQNGTYALKVRIALDVRSVDPAENSLDLLMIDVVKK